MTNANNALIIGATGGIGGALAQRLKDTHQLSLVGRNEAALRSLRGAGEVIPTDVASELEVQALFEDAGPIDLLVYSAGDIQPELLKMVNQEAYYRVLDANLTGLILTLKYAEPKLSKGARVYVLGARPELIRYRGFAVYAAAKAGVKAVMEIAATEMSRKASFTLVLPRAVATEFWNNVGTAPKDALKPDDVARAIVDSLAQEPVAELKVD